MVIMITDFSKLIVGAGLKFSLKAFLLCCREEVLAWAAIIF